MNEQTISRPDVKAFVELLLSRADELCAYEAVEEWDAMAVQTASKLNPLMDRLIAESKRLKAEISSSTAEYEAKPFWNKAFANRQKEESLKEHQRQVAVELNALADLSERLWAKIDFTPNTPEEKRTMLQVLREQKKDLQLKHRELAAGVKAIRTQARQKSAEVPYTAGGAFFGNKYTAAQRRNIRFEKENALSPYEDSLADVDLRIRVIDKMILYLERFP